MEDHLSYMDILLNLDTGTEVNIHIGNKTHYNAAFWKVNPKKRIAYFFIDQFYECGNSLTPVLIDEIDDMDLPVSMNSPKNPRGVFEDDE